MRNERVTEPPCLIFHLFFRIRMNTEISQREKLVHSTIHLNGCDWEHKTRILMEKLRLLDSFFFFLTQRAREGSGCLNRLEKKFFSKAFWPTSRFRLCLRSQKQNAYLEENTHAPEYFIALDFFSTIKEIGATTKIRVRVCLRVCLCVWVCFCAGDDR